MKLLLLDNYDSFTFNLFHLFGGLGAEVDVIRNDQITVEAALARGDDAIILSPGPCTPDEAGVMLGLIKAAAGRVPLFGVCLGHQAIGQAFGGKVVRAQPMHGKVSTITHTGRGLFRGVNGPFSAARYHSLVVERASLPPDFEIAAESPEGLIMAASHRALPVHGVQFHPESIASDHGATLCRNFLDLATAWNQTERVKTPA